MKVSRGRRRRDGLLGELTRAAETKLMGAVLIVDDSAADRALLRTVLGRAGYTVYEVSKGERPSRRPGRFGRTSLFST